MKDFSKISSLLNQYRKSEGKISWASDMENSFKKLDYSIAVRVMLHHSDELKQYIVWTDASIVGLGAWIGQINDNTVRPICFAFDNIGKKFLGHKTRTTRCCMGRREMW